MDNYKEIVDRMTENFRQAAGFVPEDTSDTGIRLRTFAAEILDCKLYAEFIKTQMFFQTACGEYLDKHAEMYGITRHIGTVARGTVRFHLSQLFEVPFLVQKGAVIKTSNGWEYALSDDLIIPAGDTSAQCDIEAVEIGANGNIGVDAVFIVEPEIEGLKMISAVTPISGGTDTESDELLRSRIMTMVKYPPNGANADYYRNIALSVNGVTSVGVYPSVNGAGTLGIYLANNGSASNQTAINAVKELMNTHREVNVSVTVNPAVEKPANISLTLSPDDGYSFEEVKQNCRASLSEFFRCINVGAGVCENDITNIIYNTEGVKNFSYAQEFVEVESSQSVLPVMGSVVIQSAEG